MRIIPLQLKEKPYSRNKFLLSACYIDENNATLNEIEAGFTQGILSKLTFC